MKILEKKLSEEKYTNGRRPEALKDRWKEDQMGKDTKKERLGVKRQAVNCIFHYKANSGHLSRVSF